MLLSSCGPPQEYRSISAGVALGEGNTDPAPVGSVGQLGTCQLTGESAGETI